MNLDLGFLLRQHLIDTHFTPTRANVLGDMATAIRHSDGANSVLAILANNAR